MVRLKQQSIPFDLGPAYSRVFGSTYEPPNLGSYLPDLNQVARTGYTPRGPETGQPTTEQLAVRAAFTTCQNELEAMPYREKRCYWRLALGSGLRYGDYYTHLHMSNIYHGQDPSEIRRPRASCLAYTEPSGFARWTIDYFGQGTPTLIWDITADPATKWNGLHPWWSDPIYIYGWREYAADPWPPMEYELIWSVNPQTRTRYTGSYTLPGAPWQYDGIYLLRNDSSDTGEIITWDFFLNAPDTTCSGENTYPTAIWENT